MLKPGGVKMTPRCSMGIAIGSSNKAYAFGGVYDTEEDEENIAGTYLNDFYILDTEKYSWRTGMMACFLCYLCCLSVGFPIVHSDNLFFHSYSKW